MKKILFLNVACVVLVVTWFHKGLVFGGAEAGLQYINLNKTYQYYESTWKEIENGLPLLTDQMELPNFFLMNLLSSFGLPNFIIQAGVFLMLLLIAANSVYLLFKITLGKELGLKYLPLIASIFYLFNPFTMTQIWGRALTYQFFSFASLPLLLLLFILGLKHKNLIYVFLFCLASFLLSTSFAHISYVLTLWIMLSLYLGYFIFTNRNKNSLIFFAVIYFLALLILWLLTNWWWLSMYFYTLQTETKIFFSMEEGIGSLRGISRQYPLPSIIRLIHNGYFYEAKYYGEIYSSILFLLISWLPPLVLIWSLRKIKTAKSYGFWLVLLLISLFVVLGSNPPLGWLFVFLFKSIPVLEVYRNPLEKFGIVYLIAYSAFFSVGILSIYQIAAGYFKKNLWPRVIVVVIMFLVCVVFVWPFWIGKFAGGDKINYWIQVPDYYKAANAWLNQQEGDFAILQLPLDPLDGIRYNWNTPYQGLEPSYFLFDKPSIARNIVINKPYYNILLDRFGVRQKNAFSPDPDLTNSEFREDKFYKELAKLNVRYIVLHSDIDDKVSATLSYEQTKQYIEKQENITKVAAFGQLEIYKVDIPKNIQFIYSPSAEIKYKKIKPYYYQIEANNVSSPYDLYFLKLFNKNWQLTIDGQPIADHNKVFSYANVWRIEKTGSYKADLRFLPQKEAVKNRYISVYAFIALATVSLIMIWRKK